MLLSEMFDRVLTESGQFILDLDDLEVDLSKFSRLVKSVLGTYSSYAPVVHEFNITSRTSEKFTFTNEFAHPLTGEVLGIPYMVPSATPLRSQSNLSPFFSPGWEFGKPGATMDLIDKDPMPFVYRKPHLYFPFPGVYDCILAFYHKLSGTGESMEVSTISENDDIFFDLLQAKCLIALGRSRRAFTLQPLELTSDAAELVSEGQAQWDAAKENLTENRHAFYLAWG